MNTQTFIMGQDIGSTQVVCYLSTSTSQLSVTVDTTQQGLSALIKQLRGLRIKPSQVHCVLEHCGFYSQRWAELSLEKGFRVSLVETKATHRVKGDHKRKDDEIDAKALCEYGQRFYDRLTDYVPLSQAQRLLAELYSLYKLEKKAITAKKQLLRSTTHESVKQQIKEAIKAHEALCKTLQKQAKDMIKQDQELQRKATILLSVPGVGPITTWRFLSHFPTDTVLEGRRLASWLGVAPGPNRSGKFIGKTKSSGYGNKDFRRLLHLGARSAVTHNTDQKAYYERKLAEGKNKQVIINNVVNKLVQLIAKLWTNNQMYDPHYSQKFTLAA